MSTEPRTAVVNIFVHKPLEIDEPDWCAGHPDQRAGYKVDISHDGHEHVIAPGDLVQFKAFLTQAPFATVDRTITLYVEPNLEPINATPDEVNQLADELCAAADQLRALADDLARILAGGED